MKSSIGRLLNAGFDISHRTPPAFTRLPWFVSELTMDELLPELTAIFGDRESMWLDTKNMTRVEANEW